MFVRSLSLGVAAVALLVSGAQAADLIIPTTPQPIYEAAGFSWDGLYAGVNVGGAFYDGGDARVTLGGAVGVNFLVSDPILVGAEIRGDYYFENDDFLSAGEFLALGRVGAVVTDEVLVYAAAGVGTRFGDGFDSFGVYALGGGVEVAVTDSVTVRGEVLGYGSFDDNNDDDFFTNAKATVGVFYHF